MMSRSAGQSWLRGALLVAALYVTIGLVTVAVVHSVARPAILFAVRLSSWLISALVFFGHTFHESRSRAPVAKSAMHAAAAVAMATETLALIATIRLALAGSVRPAMIAALIIWPLLTGAVSFAVGSALVALQRRMGGRADQPAP